MVMLLCAGALFAVLLVFARDWVRVIFGLCILSGALIVIYGIYLKILGDLVDDISDKPGLRSRMVVVIIIILIVALAFSSFTSMFGS